jgi:hypothetical protein
MGMNLTAKLAAIVPFGHLPGRWLWKETSGELTFGGCALIDYRVLGNAGIWLVGRLQTDADRKRVVEGLAQTTGEDEQSAASLARVIKRLAPRWFVMRNSRASQDTILMQPRWAMSFLRGPMTPSELRRVRLERAAAERDMKSAPTASIPTRLSVREANNIVAVWRVRKDGRYGKDE